MPSRQAGPVPAGTRRRGAAISRAAGFCGIGYAVGVGVENMDVLGAPRIGSPAADVRAAFADGGQVLTGVLAGAIALILFVVFAIGLHHRLGGGGWAGAGLAGGIAGPLLAAIGLAADAALLGTVDRLPDDAVRSLFGIHPRLQLVAGVVVGLSLLGFGVAGLRGGALTPWLAWPACVLGTPLFLTPLALLDAGGSAPAVATVGFGLFSGWVFLTGLWLVLSGPIPGVVLVRRAVFLVLVIAAGLVGLALLAVPHATAAFFSWGLAPPPLAAFAGGAYLGSAAVYAAALTRPRGQVRGLVLGAAVLSGSVLVVTSVHLDQFDLGRLQAWAWLLLFSAFTLVTSGLLVLDRGDGQPVWGQSLTPWRRALLIAVAAALGVLAVVLWTAPEVATALSPFELPTLGGRFAGCWSAMLAALAGGAARNGTVAAARFPALALVTLPAGMLIGAVRTFGQLQPAASGGYVAGLVLVLVAGCAILASPPR